MSLRFPCRIGLMYLVAVTAPAGCLRHATPPADTAVRTTVSVSSVTPTTITISGDRPTELVIRGTGFHPSDNTVVLGPVTVTTVRSTAQGTVITLVVPDRVPSGGEAAPVLWTPGSYPLTVTTPQGVSDPVMVTVKEPS